MPKHINNNIRFYYKSQDFLFLMLYALQLLLEWDKLLELMGVIPENEE